MGLDKGRVVCPIFSLELSGRFHAKTARQREGARIISLRCHGNGMGSEVDRER